MRSCLIDYPRFIPRDFLLRPLSLLRALHGLDRSLPGAPSTGGIEQIAVEGRGHAEGRDSLSRRDGSRLFGGLCCRGAETVADRLRQPRPIHLSSNIGDNVSCHFDPTFLFHETTLPSTMNSKLPYRIWSPYCSGHSANRFKQRVYVLVWQPR